MYIFVYVYIYIYIYIHVYTKSGGTVWHTQAVSVQRNERSGKVEKSAQNRSEHGTYKTVKAAYKTVKARIWRI